MSKVSEAKVEAYLVDQIKKLGGIAYKFTSPARRNVPDRLCILPFSLIMFIECKGDGGKLSKGQLKEIERLNEMGHPTAVVTSISDVDELVKLVKQTYKKKIEAAKKSGLVGLDGKELKNG